MLIPFLHFVQWQSVPALAEECSKIRMEKAHSHGFGYSKYSLRPMLVEAILFNTGIKKVLVDGLNGEKI